MTGMIIQRFVTALAGAAAVIAASPSGGLAGDEALAPVTARDAVERSIAQPHLPLRPMTVVMDVCGSGEHRAHGFLNSMADYRHRGSLNIELVPEVRAALAVRLGGDPVDVLSGHRITVFGVVRQVPIYLFRNGQPTGEFYHQTQMRLWSADHLNVVIEDGQPVAGECDALMT